MTGKTPDPAPRIANRRRALLPGLALAALALVLYLATLAPTVLLADGGEFQFVPWLPGIAHPTGYPLYTLLGWLWSHALAAGEVAWRLNLLSAVTAAVTVGLAYDLARRLFARVLPEAAPLPRGLAAAATAATLAVTHTFWSQALIAEVYALHALFVALLLWLCLKWRPAAGRTLLLLSLVFGLSLTHHRTVLLLLPGIVSYLALGRPSKLPVKHLLVKALAFALPQLLYLYLPLIAPATPYATLDLSPAQRLVLYDNSWRGFWAHVLGAVFAGELQPARAPAQLALGWALLRQQFGWVGAGLGLLGLGLLLRRRAWPELALTGLGLGGLVAFNTIYTIGDVFVLYIPVWLIVSLWIGLGWLGLAHGLADRFARERGSVVEHPVFDELAARLRNNMQHLLSTILAGLLLILPAVLLVTRYPEVDQSRNAEARRGWEAILAEPIPDGAVLLSNDRNEMMPLWYYQYVEGRRPDLLGLFPLIVTDPAYANVGRLLDQALASGRPVYLIKPMPGLALKADLIPAGQLFRAQPISTRPARPVQADYGGALRLLGYDLAAETFRPGDPLTVSLFWQPQQPLPADYTTFVHLVDRQLQGVAQSDHLPGGVYYPSSLWQAGETLRDAHTLTLPPDLPAGEYQLLVGVYHQPQPGVIEPLGDGQVVGTITVRH